MRGVAVYIRQMDKECKHGLLTIEVRKEINTIIHGSTQTTYFISPSMMTVIKRILENEYINKMLDHNTRHTLSKILVDS